jgi:hypothetical protein
MGEILCILSQLLDGNRDCIELIYEKKKIIEKTEIMKYYLTTGLNNGMINTYNVFLLSNENNEYFVTTRDDININYEDVTKGDKRIEVLENDKNIPNEFLSTFFINKCLKNWAWIRKGLDYDIRYCNHVLINCIKLLGFIRVGINQKNIFPDDEIYREFRNPTLKETLYSLNYVKNKHGATYLDTIKNEFMNYDLFVCIILREDLTVESIMGARGEDPLKPYEEYEEMVSYY